MTAMEHQGVKEKMVGAFLPTLVEITNFIKRCNQVCVNFIQQLSSVLSGQNTIFEDKAEDLSNTKKKTENENSFLNTHLFSAFIAVGELLTILLHFDSIIIRNNWLKESWEEYKTLIGRVRLDPGSFNTTEVEISQLEKLLLSIDSTLLRGNVTYVRTSQNILIPNTQIFSSSSFIFSLLISFLTLLFLLLSLCFFPLLTLLFPLSLLLFLFLFFFFVFSTLSFFFVF